MEDFKFDFGYLYNDSFSEKEFLNAVIKNIHDDYDAPSYVFDEMVLSNISRINIPIILTDGKADIEYSRMIGYDRLETTTKYKTTTYGNGYQNRSQSTSVRTITDWKKDYGTLSGSAKSGTYDDRYKIYDEYVTNHKMDRSNISQLKIEDLDKYMPNPTMIEFLKNDILNKVYSNNITYPGNHVKNEEYYGNVTLYNTTCTIVSIYAISVSIRDKEITYIAISNGDIELQKFGDYPADDFDDLFNFYKQNSNERLDATKKERKMVKYTFLFTILLFILFLVLGIAFDVLALTIISIAILLIGFIIGFKFIKDVKRISKPFYEKANEVSKREYEKLKSYKEESYQSFIRKMNN